ncbi:hypothetical protein SAMN05444682_101515 [Parapedobacter indicus]|uniref:Uncharacterized protein n=1 Tax=Parapedobacter indicus TaxID=1477437 RepID=A0A1I3DK64_9SPHI|nr:hypothetical protein CLV26_101528 [Parapedobacter indicus]SFH87142.1 hypothetical protein SAMN05444682_101515 [Parapedobacter indicus]
MGKQFESHPLQETQYLYRFDVLCKNLCNKD